MAENTATDNQATKPTPSTPLPPTPDLGDGPWGMSTGTNNPNNQRDYTREPKGSINTNGGLLGVLGNVFDKLMELLARLFGNLLGKDTESIADKKADAEFNLDMQKYQQQEYVKGKDKVNNHYEVNKSLNIPEYADKDMAAEYMMFTRFGNGKIIFTNKDGAIEPAVEASLKDNFMRAFSISIDQIRAFDGELKNKIPFAAWMASPVYRDCFDTTIDKDALIAGLSDDEKKLLKDAKFLTKAERAERFKDHPELEEKFALVQRTSLAVANADIMATTLDIENGIDSLGIPDFRFSKGGQLGSFQLTIETALERVERDFPKDKENFIADGKRILQGRHFEGTTKFSEPMVKDIVKDILQSEEYGKTDLKFITSLTTRLNNCKSKDEIALVIGRLNKVYGTEEGYLQIQQNIMNEKMAIAINKVGGLDNFNSVMYGGNVEEKGKLLVKMVNFYEFDNGKGAPISPKELYNLLTANKGAKVKDDNEALYELGKLMEKDSKAIILAGYHIVYHASQERNKTTITLNNDNVNSEAGLSTDLFRFQNLGAFLVATKGLDPEGEEKKYYLAKGEEYLNVVNGKLSNLHNDPAFKDFNPNVEHTAKELKALIEKSKIPEDFKTSGVYKDYVAMLDNSPDKKIVGSPIEHLRLMFSEKRKDDSKVYDISTMNAEVASLRKDIAESLNSTFLKDKRGVTSNREFIAYMESDAARSAFLKDQIEKTPSLKKVIEGIKAKDSVFGNEAFVDFNNLVGFAEQNQEALAAKGSSVDKIVKENEEEKKKIIAEVDKAQQQNEEKEKNKFNSKEHKIYSAEEHIEQMLQIGTLTSNKKDFIEHWYKDNTLNHRAFFSEGNNMKLAFKMYFANDYEGLPMSEEELKTHLITFLKESQVITDASEANKLLSELKESLQKHKIDIFTNQVGAQKEFEDVIERLYADKVIDHKLAGFLISSGILGKSNFENWFRDFDEMKNITVKMNNGEKMSFLDFGKQNEQGVFEKAEEAKLAWKDNYQQTMLAQYDMKNKATKLVNGKNIEDTVSIVSNQKIDDFKHQTFTILDRRIAVEGDERMRNSYIRSSEMISDTYANVDDLVKDAKDVMSLYQSDKSSDHKDFIKSHDDLAKLLNVVTYGPTICTKMGLPYEKLKEILVNELVREKMFTYSLPEIAMNEAERFIGAIIDQKRDAFDEFSSKTMSKRYEEGMESIFVGYEITPALASFLIKKGILKDEAFSRFSMFDGMNEIKVKLDNGDTISLNDFGLGTSNKNFAEEYYAVNFKKQNEEWASLAKEKGIKDKTDDAPKGLDSEALAKVKEQADNKKEDVKVASLDR